ncbi:CAP domain-containing protein [Streptomyces collinus]|uniref:CAP domain-containing protein n=1 Tax=Streptomyces collinus TaxID=42684 RepID=UPI0029429708|nr:CAP domain-containing protein [Streptomyces collinus]
MGRHRRSAAGRAAKGRATGVTHAYDSVTGAEHPLDSSAGERPRGIAPYLNPEAYAETNAASTAYLYATGDEPSPSSDGNGFTPDGTPSAGGDFAPDGDHFEASAFRTSGFEADGFDFRTDGFAPHGDPSDWSDFASDGDPSDGHGRRKRAARPVRSSLLGISAAVALAGTAAVATGMVPGLQNYQLGGATHTTGGDRVQAGASPSNTAAEQGGTSGTAARPTGGSATSGGARHPASPSAPPTPSASRSASASPSPTKTATKAPTKTPTEAPSRPASKKPAPAGTAAAPAPSRTASKAPTTSTPPVTVSRENAAEAEVLKLVNEERAKVGCSALAANSSLSKLAETFSGDMAARDFFDHTDPDGASPWDRAAKAGITDLGGENIARGQADAAAVMAAWMNSPGHRANILNCDFKTLGVGVHFASGGPWWTQDFGY